jgi:glycosyltransferase involved in cell wall biosynthesis
MGKRFGLWRTGVGSGYEVEQLSMSIGLAARISRRFDILHVQDPLIALFFARLWHWHIARPLVILAHGTEESADVLKRMPVLQHLAPAYVSPDEDKPQTQRQYVIPNFVDVQTFAPGDKLEARRHLGLPADAFIVLCVAALKKTHKRIDHLIREFALFANGNPKAHLVVAGSVDPETEDIRRQAASLGPAVTLRTDVPRAGMPELYRSADVFVLTSLHEMMPIALLEALASGVPALVNVTPTLTWMIGSGGRLVSMGADGALASELRSLAAGDVAATLGERAREQAERMFSEKVVVDQIITMYRELVSPPYGADDFSGSAS